ncbi:MAG: OmpA family protein [Treponema sp.]|jgi:outer membrane protein OmpA-like peptidoglycan-associated protein|nr:OmpA family protein [Treponema sp.]
MKSMVPKKTRAAAYRTAARRAVFFFGMILTSALLHAQIAAEVDTILSTGTVSFAQASRFVLASADTADEPSTAGAAYALARDRGWLPKKAAPDNPIRLGELCFLVMRAFDIKGSFLYALFPGSRYAFRELDYLRLIPGRRDPALRVSGEELLRMVDMVTAWKGIEVAEPAPEDDPAPAETPPAPDPAPVETPPAPDPAAGIVAAEREQIAEVIRTELEQHEVADTTVRVAEEGVVISLNNIQFTADSTELMEAEKVKLREIAAILSQYPGRRILVGGHAALAGSEEGRMQISAMRAQVTADFLLSLNVRRAEEITVWGYGADMPLGDNTTAAGQAMNRRVEITLLD